MNYCFRRQSELLSEKVHFERTLQMKRKENNDLLSLSLVQTDTDIDFPLLCLARSVGNKESEPCLGPILDAVHTFALKTFGRVAI